MNWLFTNYLNLYSFYLSTNKRTANGSYTEFARNLSFVNCLISTFGTLSIISFLIIYLLNFETTSLTLMNILIIIASFAIILLIKFRNRYSETINQLNETPKKLSLDTFTLIVIQVATMAVPLILLNLLYSLILGLEA